MNDLEERYDIRTAAAWLLGHGRRTGIPALPECMRQKTADECTDDELIQIVTAGQEAGLKLYPFKTGTQILPPDFVRQPVLVPAPATGRSRQR